MEPSQFMYENNHILKDLIFPILRKPTGTVSPLYKHKTKPKFSVFIATICLSLQISTENFLI